MSLLVSLFDRLVRLLHEAGEHVRRRLGCMCDEGWCVCSTKAGAACSMKAVCLFDEGRCRLFDKAGEPAGEPVRQVGEPVQRRLVSLLISLFDRLVSLFHDGW